VNHPHNGQRDIPADSKLIVVATSFANVECSINSASVTAALSFMKGKVLLTITVEIKSRRFAQSNCLKRILWIALELVLP
jgi:hypothetical protein